jgi:hypothetical protein
MKQITAKEFLAMIAENPSIFEYWNSPLEIISYVDCKDSKITHLSKYLTFSGKNDVRSVADFSHCKFLKTATGTFNGFVWFTNSKVQNIKDLHVTERDSGGNSASFALCESLQTASGTYAGLVSFQNSGIQKIKDLHIQRPNQEGLYVYLAGCPNLHNLEGWDLSKNLWCEGEKLEAERKRRKSLKTFIETSQPTTLPFL